MIIEQKAQFSGKFKLKVFKSKTNKLVRELEFNNLILDSGLDRLGSGNYFIGCAIGTGTQLPDVSQVALQSLSAYTTSIQANAQTVQTTTLPYYVSYVRRFRFNAGQLNGNYSEIGVGWLNNALFSRALIVDGGGNPTSITVLSDEFLDVFYELRSYIPTTDVVNSFNIPGVGSDVQITRRSLLATGNGINTPSGTFYWDSNNGNTGWGIAGNTDSYRIGTIASTYFMVPTTTTTLLAFNSLVNTHNVPFILTYNTASITNQAYVPGSLYRDAVLSTGLNQWNITFSTILVGFVGLGCYQFLFNTPVLKDGTKSFTITFRCSWGRYTP
jgi:hypothetical protein